MSTAEYPNGYNVPTLGKLLPKAGDDDSWNRAEAKWESRDDTMVALEYLMQVMGNCTPWRLARLVGIPQGNSAMAYNWVTGRFRPSQRYFVKMVLAIKLINEAKAVNPNLQFADVQGIDWERNPPKILVKAQ